MTATTVRVAAMFRGQRPAVVRACIGGLIGLLSSPLPAADGELDGPPALATSSNATILAPGTFDLSSATIGAVTIVNGSIFDLDDPEENRLLYRFANKAHITTRPEVIRQQLLFSPGDAFTSRTLEESERILRKNRYLHDATIEPVLNDEGDVDITVNTTDVWTLMPRLSLSRSGGKNKSTLGVKEVNLLGTGIEIEALYRSDVDRDSKVIKFVDHHLRNSWYSLAAVYASNSDGYTRLLDLAKPFYSLETRSAHGVSLFDNEQIDSLYNHGEVMAQYRHEAQAFEAFRGWSDGLHNNWAKRITAGLAYDNHRFSAVDNALGSISILPEDRTFLYPFVGIELVQDKYEKTENYDQVNRTEDRYLGTRLSARLGYAPESFGSSQNAWLVNAAAQTGFGDSRSSSLILAGSFATRWENAGPQNLTLDLSARYYRRQSERRLFFASLSGTYGSNLDIDNQILLGGDNGLRGYPLRYQAGDKRALLTVEQRFFTDWYPFRLFRVGAAVFADAGRTWGSSPVSAQSDGLQKDVGFGLRIGNARSGQGHTTHIDLAFPLDGDQSIKNAQFLVESKTGF